MSFPVAPIDGQIATVGGYNYQYSFATNTWTRLYSGIANSSLTLSSTTDSTSTSSGALIVTGGAGIGANAYIAGNVTASNFKYSNGQIATARHTTSSTAPVNPNVGDFWYCTQNDTILRYTYDGGGYYWVDITSPTFSNFSPSTTNIANAIYGINTVGNGTISQTGNIIPTSNLTYALGSSSFQFANIYTTNLSVTGTAIIGNITFNNVTYASNLNVGTNSTNYLLLSGQSANNNPTISAVGSDTNIGITLAPKNTGNVVASGNLSVTGSGYFFGPYNENSILSGVFVGNTGTGTPTPRVGFYNGNTSQNWQIDNNGGTFRWFTPGVTQMSLDSGGNLSVVNGNATIAGNVTASGVAPFYAPNRPAFRVSGNGGAITAPTTVSGGYFVVDYNQGSYLNTSTGLFTAPVAGLYQVNVVVRTNSNTNGTINQIIIRKTAAIGGTVTAQIMIEYGVNTTMNHAGGSTIVKMAVGDTLKFDVAVGTISFDSNDNWSVAYIG